MIQKLKTMFEEEAKQELFETTKVFHACKQENGQSGLRGSRSLKHGAFSLYVGNGMRRAVEATGSFNLVLPSGLIIILDNCHFAPTITMGVVLISSLVDNGYIYTFMNYGIYVSKDDVFYFNSILRDGIYEIDMHNLYPTVRFIYNVSNKRAKHELDSSHLWHYRPGHINKKRMDKLQRDGILQPTHDESLEKCKSCISGKMVLETFKVFQNEVENQLVLLGYALESAARILDMVSTKKVDRTPYEIWYGKAPKLSYLRVWGCEALVKRDMPEKLDSRSIKCIFVGYPKETMGYYFYHPLENKIFVAQNDEFFKIVSRYKKRVGVPDYSKRVHDEVEPNEVEPQSVEVPIHRSRRISQAPDRYGFYVDVEEHELGDLNEPLNYKAALSDLESKKWLDAMHTEMQSMKDNQVWSLVDLPPNGQTVESKWIFKKKTWMKIAIRILLAIAAFCDYEIWQMDVKPAFLNGHLSGDVYMNKRFNMEIKKIGFAKNPDELCVYLKASRSNVAFLVLYVDVILIMRNNVTILQDVKSLLCKCFSMKDLGEATYILRIKIISDRSKWLIALSTSANFDKILKKFKMENFKRICTPMQEKPDYRKSQGAQTPNEVKRMQNVPYASVIGSIMYVVRCTRPDVAFT
nr:hypothetical protein [Tanacetum cinerariifolium]